MLIDDVRENYRTLTGQLFWFGYDTRHPAFTGVAERSKDASQHPEREQLNNILDSATMYDCTPLTETLAKQWEGKRIRFVQDCFGPLPPFPITGIEQKGNGHNGLVLFQSSVVSEAPQVREYFLKETAMARPGNIGVKHARFADDEDYVLLTDAKWMVSVSVLMQMPEDNLVFIDNFLAYFCDSRGQLLTAPIANEQLNVRLNTQPNETITQVLEQVMQLGLQHFNSACAVLNLMACKNVASEVRTVAPRLQRARARRGKAPLQEYRILTVTLPGNAKRGRDAQTITAHAGEPLPLQTIPGQYRDYRENGLFGKYKGIFWVPAHMRGDKEAGEVKQKSYEAKAAPINQSPQGEQHETVTN